jgi:hypothetical protein
MGTYYKCLCGDSEHLGLVEPDSVAVQDATGRNWICYPIPDKIVDELSMLEHLNDVHWADFTATKQGFATVGTQVRIYYCEDEDDLFEKLSEDEQGGDDSR